MPRSWRMRLSAGCRSRRSGGSASESIAPSPPQPAGPNSLAACCAHTFLRVLGIKSRSAEKAGPENKSGIHKSFEDAVSIVSSVRDLGVGETSASNGR